MQENEHPRIIHAIYHSTPNLVVLRAKFMILSWFVVLQKNFTESISSTVLPIISATMCAFDDTGDDRDSSIAIPKSNDFIISSVVPQVKEHSRWKSILIFRADCLKCAHSFLRGAG